MDMTGIRHIIPILSVDFDYSSQEKIISYRIDKREETKILNGDSKVATLAKITHYQVYATFLPWNKWEEIVNQGHQRGIKPQETATSVFTAPESIEGTSHAIIYSYPKQGLKIEADVICSVNSLTEQIVPYLRDPTEYDWLDIKKAIISFLCGFALRRSLPVHLRELISELHSLTDFISAIFAAKWQIGLGKCANDPDPINFSYPVTDPEWRAWWEWESIIVPQIWDDLSRELGLDYHKMHGWSPLDPISYEEWQKRSGEYRSSRKQQRDFELIRRKMEERGITFENFHEGSKDRYPPVGAFKNLKEVLNHKYGGDWDKCLPLAEEARKVVNPDYLSPEGMFLEGKMNAEMALGDVWVEYYGWKALWDDLEKTYIEFVRKADDILDIISTETRELTYGETFETFREVEVNLRTFVKKNLFQSYGARWWYEGIPEEVRKQCAERQEHDKGKHERLEYADFDDIRKIVVSSNNWGDIFKALLEEKGKSKESSVHWLVRLNNIRQDLMHSRPVGDEYKGFIKMCYEKTLSLLSRSDGETP